MSASFPTAWERYYAHLKLERAVRPRSIRVIRGILYGFNAWLGGRKRPKTWDQAGRDDLSRFIAQPARRPDGQPKPGGLRLADNTRASYASTVTRFYRWAYDQRILPRNPMRGFVLPKASRPVARALDLADVERALVAAATDPRMTAMLWLMYGAGLRAMEVAALRIENLRLAGDPPLLEVRDGKGGKSRQIPLAAPVATVLRRYLDTLPGTTGPLVTSRTTGRAIHAQTVSRLLSDHLHAAGIKDSGHALRHTFATELLKAGKGANLYAVSRALGHSSTEITEHVYVASYVGDLGALAALLPDPRGNGHRPRVEPTGLAAMVPVDVRDQLAGAVATLERLGPDVARAVATLGRCTTLAWLATLGLSSPDQLVGMRAGDLPDHSDEEWAELEAALGIDRGWTLAYALRDAVDK